MQQARLHTLLSSPNTADMPDDEVLVVGPKEVGPLGWKRLPGGGGGGADGPPLGAPAKQRGRCAVLQ